MHPALPTATHLRWMPPLRAIVLGCWLSWGLGCAPAWAAPPSAHEQAQLREAANFQSPQQLRTLFQQIEQRHDLSDWPVAGFYRALLAQHAQRPSEGLQHLAVALPYFEQQWHDQPTAHHAEALATAWQLQGVLHDALAETAQRNAAFDRAADIAYQGLPPEAPLRPWLRFRQMLHAFEAQQWPQVRSYFEQLVRELPVPLEQCRSALCWQLRFQEQRFAEGLQYTTAQRRALLRRLVHDLEQDPTSPIPTLLWTQYMQVNDALHHEEWDTLLHLCTALRQHPLAEHPEAHIAWRQARSLCAEGLEEDNHTFTELLAQEAAARGLASTHYGNLLLRQLETALARTDLPTATAAAGQVWAVSWANQDPYLLWRSQHQLAYVMAEQHRLPEAVFHAKLAIQAQQNILRGAQAISEAHAQAMLQDDAALYDDLAQWLLQLHRLPEAERALTLAREHGYHRQVRGYRPQLLDLPLTTSEQQHLNTVLPLRKPLHDAWRLRTEAPEQLAPLLHTLTPTLHTPLAQAAPENTHAAQPLLATQPPAATAASPSDSTELRLLPGHQQLHAIVRRPGLPQIHITLPLAEADLVRSVAQLRQQLQQPGSDIKPLAQQLYQKLWAPLAAHLPAGQPQATVGQAPQLQLQLEGVLRYLPLALLHDGQHWLGESYALALQGHPPSDHQPSAAAPRQGWALLGSSASTADLPPLPLVAQELADIGQQARLHGITHDIALDQQFTPQRLAHALRHNRVVHIASHFRLTPGDGAASGLVLGNGELLSLLRMEQSSLQWQGLDLLTLSACETALPTGAGSHGLSVDSLAWLAQAKGARHVLASLWAVSDQGTQPFMQAFYQALAQGVPHAQATRAAQLALLRSPASTTTEDDLRHPYFWSAFVLLGPGQPTAQVMALHASHTSAAAH